MANKTLIIGLVPKSTVVNQPITRATAPCEATAALFVNSPIVITSGVATAVGTANSSKITGTIVCIRDPNGLSVCSKPASSSALGTYVCEYTYEPGQLYICTVNGTIYADSDAGDYFILNAETATANANPDLGDSTSKRQLITKSATDGPIQVIGRTPLDDLNNAASVTGTQVLCRINPTNYVAAN